MKRCLLLGCLISFSIMLSAQKSDFIVLKKRNNRTLKTYFPGTFISGVTFSGFTLNGIIKKIENDSIFIEQQSISQVPTQFGVPRLDTVFYTIGLYYKEINSFYYTLHTGIGGAPRQRGFRQNLVPQLMILGGGGFALAELVNTAYRKESLSDGNKLPSIAVATGVAAVGVLWQQLNKQRAKAGGGRYRVEYINMD